MMEEENQHKRKRINFSSFRHIGFERPIIMTDSRVLTPRSEIGGTANNDIS
jgi:hypothetical protein